MAKLDDIRQHPELKDKHDYEALLKKYQLRILRLQQKMHQRQLRAVVAFEGWDAAGKGGAIRRLTEKLDPRGFKVYPIAAPRPDEQGRHYLWRVLPKLPAPGGRAGCLRTLCGRVRCERVRRVSPKDDADR